MYLKPTRKQKQKFVTEPNDCFQHFPNTYSIYDGRIGNVSDLNSLQVVKDGFYPEFNL